MTKVLLIEDDPLIYRLYQKLFTLEGFQIELADNGLSGLEVIPVFQPDVILLDIMMPTMNGIEMLGKIKAEDKSKDTPVIVLTNVSDSNVTHMALQAGAVVCLIKSQTEPADVVATVKGVLAKTAADQQE